MHDTYLKIKTTMPPLNKGAIKRARVEMFLNETAVDPVAFSHQLTLIAAPAGFGKTTLARHALSGFENASGWFTVEEDDNVFSRFYGYLIQAIQSVAGFEHVGKTTRDFFRSQGLETMTDVDYTPALTALLNDLFDVTEPLRLVLDDYQRIDNQAIQTSMAYLIEHMPAHVHCIVLTRSDPPWPLHRWRAQGRMRDVRLHHIRFTFDEAKAWLETAASSPIEEGVAKTLYTKTEGWAAGLVLALQSLEMAEDPHCFLEQFAGTHQSIYHYLVEEVIRHWPDDTLRNVMQSSVITRFNTALFDFVTAAALGRQIIADLTQHNQFIIPLDDTGEWYRYHPLFADLLVHRLKQHDPTEPDRLRLRAATWHLAHHQPSEALAYARAAQDKEMMASIYENHLEGILQEEGPDGVRPVLDLDDALLKRHPRLIAYKALFLLVLSGGAGVEALLQMGEACRYTDTESQTLYEGMLAAVRSHYALYGNHFEEAVEHGRKALELVPEHHHFWRVGVEIFFGDVALFSGKPEEGLAFYTKAHLDVEAAGLYYPLMSTGIKQTYALLVLGRLTEAESLIESMFEIARQYHYARLGKIGSFWVMLGDIYRARGDFESAKTCIERGLSLSKSETIYWSWNHLFKLALSFSEGDIKTVEKIIRHLEQLNARHDLPKLVTAEVTGYKVRLALTRGAYEQAETLLGALGVQAGQAIPRGMEMTALNLVRLHIERKQYAGAGQVLDVLEARALANRQKPLHIKVLLLKARLLIHTQDVTNAEARLEQALRHGADEQLDTTYREEQVATWSITKPVVSRLKQEGIALPASLGDSDHRQADAVHKPAPKPFVETLIEPLSIREEEVLALVAKGRSNQEIADTLHLSLATIKWHTGNIYGKLGVNSRTKAVAAARRIGLLDGLN